MTLSYSLLDRIRLYLILLIDITCLISNWRIKLSRLGIPNKSRLIAADLAKNGATLAFEYLERVVKGSLDIVDSPSDSDRIAAAKVLLAYAFGKPPETIQHQGVEGEDVPAIKVEYVDPK